MMPPPILPQEAAVADWMLATHKHSDHFDPWTVSGMFAFNTINPKEARQAIQRNASIDTGCCAELDVMYTLMEKDQNDDGSF